ncbi:sugar transferase [Euzebya tangerina]|uniref:sugar transferase n=1 Tax=Euzebya tangerina TaxID=591198 RepID=UPI000E3163EA|nr:sugar transferase [Euzebya tangerina]
MQGKRLFDLLVGIPALAVAAVPMLVVAALVRLLDGSPVLFRQQRVGRHGRDFTILKFRTMRTGQPGAEVTVGGDVRITRLGAVLRRFKLDELPQLWNVVRGDMSLVGPRPEVRRYVELFPEAFAPVLTVRPGITDPASLAFRHEAELLAASEDGEQTYREVVLPRKLALSTAYVREASWTGDLRIIGETLRSLLR